MSGEQIVVIIFGCLYFIFVLYTRKKTNFSEYAVAGRSLGSFLIFASLSATQIGPGNTMAVTREGFNQGMYYYLVIGGVGLQGLITSFFFAKQIFNKFPTALSSGDVIAGENSHNSKIIKLMIGILTFSLFTAISIIMSKAGGYLLNHLFGWPEFIAVIVVTLIIVSYSFFGGIRATILTDAFQLAHFAILIPVLILFLLLSDQFSSVSFLTHIEDSMNRGFNNFNQKDLGLIGTWLFLGFMFPSNINRILASKNGNVAKRAMLQTAIFMFIWMFLMVLLGDLGGYLYPGHPISDYILLDLANIHYPPIFYGIFIVAMIGVVMSTQDSTLNSASVIFSNDILGSISSSMSNEKKLKYSKFAVIGIGLVCMITSQFLDSLLGAFSVVTSVFAPVYIPSVVFSVYIQNPRWEAAMASMISAAMVSLSWIFLGMEDHFPTLFVGLPVGFISYLIVHFHFRLRNK